MKKLLLAAATMLAFASAAEATTYNTYVTATPYRVPGAAGLQTRAVVLSRSGPQNFNGASYNFNLNSVGDSASMDIYGLVQYDGPLNSDDLIPKPSTATFDFGGLIGSITILGTSVGVLGKPDYAIATFVSDVIRISSTQGILISIRDTIFGTNGVSFVNGRAGIGFVNATFTLAAVPLPAALPLSLLALGAIGVAGRRRKSALAA
jgi:hypothetical protein